MSDTPEDVEAGTWFNLRAVRLWPHQELVAGDTLYWCEMPSQVLRWKSRVLEVERFPYSSKAQAETLLRQRGWIVARENRYFLNAADAGVCLAYRVGWSSLLIDRSLPIFVCPGRAGYRWIMR